MFQFLKSTVYFLCTSRSAYNWRHVLGMSRGWCQERIHPLNTIDGEKFSPDSVNQIKRDASHILSVIILLVTEMNCTALIFRHFWDKNMATVPSQPRSPLLSLRSSLEQLTTKTMFSCSKNGSGEMTTQSPRNICCSQSHHCCLTIVTMRTMSYVRRRLLIGGWRLRGCRLLWEWPLKRCLRKTTATSITCQVLSVVVL